MAKEKYGGPCLYEISGQTKLQYALAYDDQIGQLFHHPQLDITIFRGQVTIKNLGKILINPSTLERLTAELK